ncbi:MAG: extracellular solute-binding protein [Candidatus Promineifilaceae bacterium]|nr:extracellular solute-binding protein [Candidatus Promineifilaceae bacterium]
MVRGIFFSLVLLLLAVGCGGQAGQQGPILLWHSWTGSAAQALTRAVDQFEAITPGVRVIMTAVPAEQAQADFRAAAALGLGPDVVLAPNSWVGPLAEAGLLRPLPSDSASNGAFLGAAIRPLSHDGQLYGLPLALQVEALYYNRQLTDERPQTLAEMLTQGEAGSTVAVPTNFAASYWGIAAHGPPLFDDQGMMQPTSSGLEAWLAWLTMAQARPGLVLDRDQAALQTLFAQGEVATFIGRPEALGRFTQTLGQATVDVGALPEGPEGVAAPILVSEGLLFNRASSDSQAAIALELARFLTNREQSAALLRDAGIVPANRNVRINARLYPVQAAFYSQALTAAQLPDDLDLERFQQAGETMLGNVLAGVQDPRPAVCAFGRQMAEGGQAVNLEACPESDDE